MSPPAPKPGVIPLRRLGVGEILDGAVSYIRANPKVTLGLSAVVITISQLIQVPLQSVVFGGRMVPVPIPGGILGLSRITLPQPNLPGQLLAGVVSFVAGTLLTGLLMVVLSRAVLGHRAALGEVWSAARGRLLGLCGIVLLLSVATSVVVGVGIAAVVIAVALRAPMLVLVSLGVVLIVAVGLVVYLFVSWSLSVPAYVLEDISVVAALRRSFRLVRGQWWRIFGILLLGYFIATVLGGILTTPFTVAGLFVNGGLLPKLTVSAVGAIIGGTITKPFSAGIIGLLYFDQRIRREGLDIELARAADAQGAAARNDLAPGSS